MRTTGSASVPRADLSRLAREADPYPEYAQLRKAGPLWRVGPGSYALTRYADVAALLNDPRLGSAFPSDYYRVSAGVGPAQEFLERIMLHVDGAKHNQFRKVLGAFFNAAAMQQLRDRVRLLVCQLAERACDARRIDAVRDLAQPLPAMVIFDMMGISVSDYSVLRNYVIDLGKAFATLISNEDRSAANTAVVWLRQYATDLLEERRRSPGLDLVSHILKASGHIDNWSQQDSVDNILFVLFAGFETTSSVLSTGYAALSQAPEQFNALRSNPSMSPTAVEEFIRYDAPIQSRLRMVHKPVRIAGRTIMPGRVLVLLIGSANRDEAQFQAPDVIDIARNPNPHLSFGGGDHVCLGMGLARMEGKLAFEELAQRFSAIRPAGEFTRNLNGPFRGFSELPIEVISR